MFVTYARFKEDVQRCVETYLGFLADAIKSAQLSAPAGHIFLFPTTLVFAKTTTHYAFELFGGRSAPGRLAIKENKSVKGFNHLVNGLSPDASTTYLFGTEDSRQTNIDLKYDEFTLTCVQHSEDLSRRFPAFKAIAPKAALAAGVSGGSVMAVNAEPIRTLTISHCLITSNLGEVVRARYVNLLFGQSVQADREELVRDLNSTLSLQPARSPIGIQVAPGSDQQAHVAAGFTSLYLLGAAEPTLTEFLEQHDDVIRRVFHAEEIFYQQELPWQEGNSEPSEESIQPDILVRRLDGTWIIIEFKLPLLDRQRITKRERRRRGFIDAVDEGISQLFNYQDYFSFPANREVARRLLGQSPSTPELVLVVGNSENVNGTEVREAQRSRRPFVLIDYDSLIGLYMAPLPSVPSDSNP